MAASNTDKFKKLTNNFSTTLSAPIVGAGDTSMSLASTTNLPTDTGTVFVVDRVNSSGTATPTTREYIVGTVSGSNIINLVRGVGNSTAQAHSTGAVVEQVVDQRTINDLMDGILNQHNQDGTHAAVTATSVAATGAVTGASFNTSSPNGINQAALPLGTVVQIASTNFSAVATGTTLIPEDDTIPQNTEGDQYMTQIITPKSATNRLYIRCVAMVSQSTSSNDAIGALFQDSTANALAAKDLSLSGISAMGTLIVEHDMVAGTTSATTFKFRAGLAAAGTLTFNGFTGARKFGGITLSTMTITEYKA